MTLEELKKLISKDETKNIEPQNEPQNEHQNEPQKRALTIESLIVENESISINAIAERLNAARITVRRDLKKLSYAWEGALKNGRWVREL
ncbi:DeoR family transcriptional regulator [Fibrobacter sp.]